MKDKLFGIAKHPATWAFIGTCVGAFCPKCTPWVQVIGGMITGA